MEFVHIAEYAENQALSGGVSAILQSGLILENIRRMFFVKIHVHCPGSPDRQQKHSSNFLEKIALTSPERA